ncbi:hypothetical protein [Rhodococcus sp. SJ-2]
MKRAAINTVDVRTEIYDSRLSLYLGRDNYVMTATEAYRVANILVDAAEQLTARQETTDA